MFDQCRLDAFMREIITNVQRDGSITFPRLLKLMGPDIAGAFKYEFWAALSYALGNQKIKFSGRNRHGVAILVPSVEVPLPERPTDWYLVNYSWSYINGGSRYERKYCVPPIPQQIIAALFSRRKPNEDLQVLAYKMLRRFPELALLNFQDGQYPNARIISQVLSPVMMQVLPKKVVLPATNAS